jgi:hypothetical protein
MEKETDRKARTDNATPCRNIELRVITEKENSPFRHTFDTTNPHGKVLISRRYPYSKETLRLVQKELLDSLGLPIPLRSLEIGAGSSQAPSEVLGELGATVFTLDLDWHEHYTFIPTVEDLEKLGDAVLFPMKAGNGTALHYLGDVGFINHERSQLKGINFGLVFFWGSIHGTGLCSSVAASETATELNIEMPLEARLTAPIRNIDSNGALVCISGFFNQVTDPIIGLGEIIYSNNKMIDTMLMWAGCKEKNPKDIMIFGLSNGFSIEPLSRNADGFCSTADRIEIIDAVRNKVVNRAIEEHINKRRQESGYGEVLGLVSAEQQEAIANLCLIDCIAVRY